MTVKRIHEREVNFFNTKGHNHDGENSTPIEIGNGVIHLANLGSDVLQYIANLMKQDSGAGSIGFAPDLEFTTGTIQPGGIVTGTVPWVSAAFVRFVRIVQSPGTLCTLTFYHNSSFLDEDREFRCEQCTNYFMWEGVWAHLDEGFSHHIYYSILNTGPIASAFKVQVKGIAITS